MLLWGRRGSGEEGVPLLHQGLQQDTGTTGTSFLEVTTSLFAGTSHTARLMPRPRSSLPLPALDKVIHFTSKLVRYSRSVQAIRHPWYLQDTTQMPSSYLHHAATTQPLGTSNNPETTQGQGQRTHHSGLTGSPLHLLLICHTKLSCDGKW